MARNTASAAIALWIRSTLRHRARSTLLLAISAGLAASVVGLAAQGARRSEHAVARYLRVGRTYDIGVTACPPGVDTTNFTSTNDLINHCGLGEARRFADLLRSDSNVERVNISQFALIGVLDPTAPNGFGRVIVAFATFAPGEMASNGRPIVVAGSPPPDSATDAVMVSETAAAAAGWHVGDELHMASWTDDERDQAVNEGIRPSTPERTVRISGIARIDADLQRDNPGLLPTAVLPGALLIGPGLANDYAASITGYGYPVAVRLVGGGGAVDSFTESLARRYPGWTTMGPSPTRFIDPGSLGRLVGTERLAVWIVTGIIAVAALAFVALTTFRQVRRELDDIATLRAIGLSARSTLGLGAARGLTLAVPAIAVFLAAMVIASPLTPFATARRLEYHRGIRLDLVALSLTAGLLLVAFVGVGALSAFSLGSRRPSRKPRRSRPSVAGRSGPVAAAGLSFARNGSARPGIAVATVAVAAVIGAGGLVGSANRVVAQPARYGAWWDVSVGNYSEPELVAAAITALRDNPYVIDAATFRQVGDGVTLNGRAIGVISIRPVKGRPDAVLSDGRMPATNDEITLSIAAAKLLHASIGDTVHIDDSQISQGTPVGSHDLRVVGLAVALVSLSFADGDTVAFVADTLIPDDGTRIAQDFQIRFAPNADRSTALASLNPQFSAFTVVATPGASLRNLIPLRAVPWLIALLVGALALVTVVHNFVTILNRHRRDLGVLGALGFTRRQLRFAASITGSFVMVVALAFGIPLGVVAGRLAWTGFARGLHLVSGPVVGWAAIGLAIIGALVVVNAVAVISSRRPTRAGVAETLRAP